VRRFDCPSLKLPVVELTDERALHIERRHPDLLPNHMAELEAAVGQPDSLRPDAYNPNKCAFVKWFPNLLGGKFVIAQVVSEWAEPPRHWIVTAYLDSVPPS